MSRNQSREAANLFYTDLFLILLGYVGIGMMVLAYIARHYGGGAMPWSITDGVGPSSPCFWCSWWQWL